MRDYVFGYGSLAMGGPVPSRRRRREGFVAELRGVRRRWGVAMDNAVDIPGYKCYLEPGGARPAVSVCFLDIEPDSAPGAAVNGVCLPVEAAGLAALDRRERNYERVEVTDRILPEARGLRVWAYRGSAAGRARFATAVHAGRAVIHAEYLRMVRAAFRALGPEEWAACAASLHPRGVPVAELVRRELPPAAAAPIIPSRR
ncbi:MAG TPA: gamma-glutamylcyclotransferase family protein [Solirubrobacteraceae bacterium]|nr:gamma-glutamylcyclotransferase family protein [Solirubrobacteraceae bacterium]